MAETLYLEALRAHLTGRTDSAVELLDRALAKAPDAVVRARIQHLRGMIGIWAQAPLRIHELLCTEAATVEALDPGLATAMLATAAQAAVMAGEAEMASETSARALAIATDTENASRASAQAFDLVLARTAVEREQAIRQALANPRGHDAPGAFDTLHHNAAVLYWLEDYPNAERLLQFVIDQARVQHHPILPVALDTLGALSFRTGRWSVADARSAEALRLARELGQHWVSASCLTTLARVAAARGREQECRDHLREAGKILDPSDLTAAYAASVAALLELGLGRPETAIAELEPLRSAEASRLPWAPMVVPWIPDLIEALVRTHSLDDAAETLQSFQQRAIDSRRAWALAGAARCSGLLAGPNEFEHHFTEALRYHALTPTPFERARTELCFGERLRRSRRHQEAATTLRSALGTFERLGAVAWAERARRELAGKRTPAKNTGTITQLLTPHELQVASLIERGATNRQVANILSVTPRTIDYHLTNIYRKLDIHTRTELAYRLSHEPARN